MNQDRSGRRWRTWVWAAAAWLCVSTGAGGIFAADRLRRGDANVDGSVDISDPVGTLNALFGGAGTLPCEDAGDANDDGALNIADPVYTLNYLFAGSSPPPAPFPDCGEDPTPDALACESYPSCPPVVECASTMEVEAEIAALAPMVACVPADAAEYEVAGVVVAVCPASEAGACGEAAEVGCGVDVDTIEATVDPVAGEAYISVEGGARGLPIAVTSLLGTTLCSADLPFAADVVVPFTTEVRGDSAVEVVGLGDPILEGVELSLTVEGGLVCDLLEGAADQVLDQIVAQVESSLAELLLATQDSLLGRVLCLD